ncbi:hypothetical protein SAMN05421737_101301 [Shouchella lonarensis]|uniref:Uncharacterized protein n=1 Tax=Shouchella lonarensis TaxID=1464122 RepID=A0A1G6GNP4_9BACI|nr:hypothetical protein SAMN05421737_101301 [Shouchella lonarensis]
MKRLLLIATIGIIVVIGSAPANAEVEPTGPGRPGSEAI